MRKLLLDGVLPRPDHDVVLVRVFRADPETCFRTAVELDVLQHPLLRGLVRLRRRVRPGAGPSRLRIVDLTKPALGWVPLAERRGRELVLGRVSRPWRGADHADFQPGTADEFATFDLPGYAKLALSVRAEPYGLGATILTLETRVALTDPFSRRRFARYWRVIGPLGLLVRRLALHRLSVELAGPRRDVRGEIEIERPTDIVFDTVADERNEPRYNPRLSGVKKTSPGPVGVGTTFQAQTTSLGRSVPMTTAFTDVQRPRRLASATHTQDMDIDGVMTFDPTPRGTRMTWAWDVHPRGLAAAFRPVVVAVGRRQERAVWGRLKRYLEGRASAGEGAEDRPSPATEEGARR